MRLWPESDGARVTLLLTHSGHHRRALELWSLVAAVLLSGLAAYFSARLAWQSHAFNDISTANDATPLWIPQLAMAAGSLILLIAFVDELVHELRSPRAGGAEASEALRNE